MTLVNKFLTTDKDDIVIRDPISKEEISTTKLLNLIDAAAPGTVGNPFIVDAPQGIWNEFQAVINSLPESILYLIF
jgi:hypothetical protein